MHLMTTYPLLSGLLCGVIGVAIIYQNFGPFFAFLSIFVFPITLMIAPLYTLFVNGSWLPAVIVYGCVALYIGFLIFIARTSP